MENKAKISIRDIAEKAGVSKSLVALALNDRYGVNSETRLHILHVAHQMGYDFTRIRKQHKSGRAILSILVDKQTHMTETFWREIFWGIERAANEKNVLLDIITYEDYNNRVEINKMVSHILHSETHGIIVVFRCNKNMLDEFLQFSLPIILVEPQEIYDLRYTHIRGSYYNGAYEVADYLIRQGHKHLAFVGNLKHCISFRLRYHGFKDRISQEEGIRFSEIVENSTGNDLYDKEVDKECFLRVINSPDRPTAVFFANDPLAIRYIDIFKELNLSVPEDISVVGFDNDRESALCEPKLTTCQIEAREIGRQAIEAMLEKIAGCTYQKIIEVSTRFVERESVKNLNK